MIVLKIQESLVSKQLTFSVAESCTGGRIAHQITSVAGSSKYFVGGVVAYSNEVKTNVLGVRKKDINEFGAVSKTVAIQMAQGVRKLLSTDIGVSTTGIAGPTGGSEEKPVGTVWIAISTADKTIVQKSLFNGNRAHIIEQSSQKALDMIIEVLA